MLLTAIISESRSRRGTLPFQRHRQREYLRHARRGAVRIRLRDSAGNIMSPDKTDASATPAIDFTPAKTGSGWFRAPGTLSNMGQASVPRPTERGSNGAAAEAGTTS